MMLMPPKRPMTSLRDGWQGRVLLAVGRKNELMGLERESRIEGEARNQAIENLDLELIIEQPVREFHRPDFDIRKPGCNRARGIRCIASDEKYDGVRPSIMAEEKRAQSFLVMPGTDNADFHPSLPLTITPIPISWPGQTVLLSL